MYLKSIANFRALAIVLIVIGHTNGIAHLDFDDPFHQFYANFIAGGTSLFVFISGYMLHHAFAPRFEYTRFLVKKLKIITFPYIVLSALAIGYSTIWGTLPSAYENNWYILATLHTLIMGSAIGTYWYIPFIMLMFSLAPLHLRYLKLSFPTQAMIFAIVCIIGLLVQRPTPLENAFHNFLAFSPAYLLGMLCSQYRTQFLGFVRGKEIWLLGLALLADIIQIWTGHIGNYHKSDLFTYAGFDLMLLQKLLLSLALFALFERWQNFRWAPITLISRTSFTIYFLHLTFIFVISHTPKFSPLWRALARPLCLFFRNYRGLHRNCSGHKKAFGAKKPLFHRLLVEYEIDRFFSSIQLTPTPHIIPCPHEEATITSW